MLQALSTRSSVENHLIRSYGRSREEDGEERRCGIFILF
ncbi:hypothetical protein ES319_D02G015700v1 [Gossypium barbadense]|uniref:Uncharacterized protein n=1 Tax=Gossypium barbadense TaxID=3634 RepID=A0A5J5S7D6_GOSBA|nr:hypothetical protein ES319_D02G015700v1 [Gossypium barbadense]